MRGIDTNILVRFLTRDDEKQAKRAAEILTKECGPESPGFLTNIVVVELVWTLSRIYQYPRPQIVAAIRALLNSKELRFESPDELHAALEHFEEGRADFADYLIGSLAVKNGCEDTLTFDKKAAKLPFFSHA
ncbi:type II toxin-antitoxin system VapC family toxin [Roseibacillus persicicus]|uniref:PIN domain-containing protein n=1 Tax=Roseibacillus persicicus TaxID=454148 RepID=UPI00398A7F49